MSSKETGSKAREYTSISSTASNEGFGVESELVEMPASCESEIANEEMDRTLRCFEPVQLHRSGEAPRHDEPKRPTTYLRMRADNAPLPRRRTNRSYNEQEDGIKTCASSKKPNTSTAAPLYKELKKDDYYWF
ncbi:hypothetical protein HYC85_031326 [Camellia sinensis]|uniref:Uncharacterized protein n=1 Tax=Camellia sinensis TaxID=4442 RepID=A0A7J7FQB2_CAMSI|nr:hypothetical protein HYC85_031326 [Camellia sinensis]